MPSRDPGLEPNDYQLKVDHFRQPELCKWKSYLLKYINITVLKLLSATYSDRMNMQTDRQHGSYILRQMKFVRTILARL